MYIYFFFPVGSKRNSRGWCVAWWNNLRPILHGKNGLHLGVWCRIFQAGTMVLGRESCVMPRRSSSQLSRYTAHYHQYQNSHTASSIVSEWHMYHLCRLDLGSAWGRTLHICRWRWHLQSCVGSSHSSWCLTFQCSIGWWPYYRWLRDWRFVFLDEYDLRSFVNFVGHVPFKI